VFRLLIPVPEPCPNSRKPGNLFGALRTETVQVRVLKTTTYSLFLVTLGAASVNAQPSPARTEAPSPLSEIAHDISTWFTRTTGTDTRRHREGSLPAPSLRPLPRPRPTGLTSVPVPPNKEPSELTTATAPPNKEPSELSPAPPNNEPSELTAAPVAPKKKAPAPVLIND
jgi:hypothetical protein